jgi:dTDP-4-amino-4,6-dideoxygalactose transaminase
MYRHGREEIEAVSRVIASGQWSRFGEPANGCFQEAVKFEEEWAKAVGSPHACLTSNGTSALMCCYAGLGLGPGDEVIVPGYTWVASAQAPLSMGLMPIIVDVDETLTLDPEAVERAITPRTKAICPVHMNGLSSHMDRLVEICKKHKLFLIEDACQADGGVWKDGRKLGTIGEMGAYSYNFYKTISCGEGGTFVAQTRKLYERGLIFHDGGVSFRAKAKEIGEDFFCGLNLRGNEILAAMLRVQLTRMPGIIADLHKNRKQILARIGNRVQRMQYCGGDTTGTGGYIGLKFGNGDQSTRFCAALGKSGIKGLVGSRPIDSGRHVYRNWESLLKQQGAWHKLADPFLHPANIDHRPKYSEDMLPRTLGILERTALVAVNPDWSEAICDSVAEALTKAYEASQAPAALAG